MTDIVPGRRSPGPTLLTPVGDRIFFEATTNGMGEEAWVSDGTPAGTVMPMDVHPGEGGGYPSYLIGAGDSAIFVEDDGVHGNALWRTDGTAAGTALVADVDPGRGGYGPIAPLFVADPI